MDIKRIHEMRECLTSWALAEIQKGKEHVCTEELGEVIDMIKDLADAEKDCYEAKIFKEEVEGFSDPLTKLMKHKWYTPSRDSRGRYTTRHYDDTKPMMDGYRDPMMDKEESKYGIHYDHYDRARRYYTSTKSPEYKMEMDQHAHKHVDSVIATMEDIWQDADPEMRRDMKTKLQQLVSEMA